MSDNLQELSIGIQTFEMIRHNNLLYVDKTARLQKLVTSGKRYFLSRPRRFGKSLMISTLSAMFSGRIELFKGLAVEQWVKDKAQNPSVVLTFDMSAMNSEKVENFEQCLTDKVVRTAKKFNIPLVSKTIEGMFEELVEGLYEVHGPLVVLIDEYDKPMLDNIGNLETANAMRQTLRSFYIVLKSCDQYLGFVMLTGISKFSKTGVFSALNNLEDISMDRSYGDIAGYTQQELEVNFAAWIDDAAQKMKLGREQLLEKMKDYYDGFCFDGETAIYNPFSIMQCLKKADISNYWYDSGSPSFIVDYMKQHGIQDPAEYAHLEVAKDFTSSREIEHATPESFLYQSGYLSIEERREDILVLKYPNYEVRKSLIRMYLDEVYNVKNYITVGKKLWQALSDGNLEEVIKLYNAALASVPYSDFTRQDEALYRSLFLMLLRGAGVTAHGEVPTNLGRSDVLVYFPKRVIILELKLARKKSEIGRLRKEGMKQIEAKGYAKPYDAEERAVTSAVIVIDGEQHEAVL